MRMKIMFMLSFCLAVLSSYAQTKQQAEKDFITQLNDIVRKSSEPSPWANEGKYSIDSLFHISKTGILSITFRYTTDTSFVRVRMAAPVSKIKDVFYDYYLGFEFKQNLVTIYKAAFNKKALKEYETDFLFHIGVPIWEGEKKQENLQKALATLQKYYKG